MNKTVVIGVGSPFGDDNIAQEVIAQLLQAQADGLIDKAFHIVYQDRPGYALLELIQGYQTVYIIDAMVSDKPVGFIHYYDSLSHFQQAQNALSSHNMGVAEVLALGEVLGMLPEKLHFYGVEINTQKNIDINQLVTRIS